MQTSMGQGVVVHVIKVEKKGNEKIWMLALTG